MNILRSISFINDKHSMHENRVPLKTTFLSNSKCVERVSINHMEDVGHGNKLHKHYYFLTNPLSINFSYLRHYFSIRSVFSLSESIYLHALQQWKDRMHIQWVSLGFFTRLLNHELINPERRRQDKELQYAECLLFLFFVTVSSWL